MEPIDIDLKAEEATLEVVDFEKIPEAEILPELEPEQLPKEVVSEFPVGSPSHPAMVELINQFVYSGDDVEVKRVNELFMGVANTLAFEIGRPEVVACVEALVSARDSLFANPL